MENDIQSHKERKQFLEMDPTAISKGFSCFWVHSVA